MQTKLNIIPICDWCSCPTPLIISGPCSAETEQQVLETAEAIAGIQQVGIFRAGIWKPRTRPGDFEGVGIKGLKWLYKAREKTGLKIAVEIGNVDHIKACFDHEIDILWIGARTVANPFSIQEIAEVLENTNIPVMIKNPVNPDINLWIGALERLNRSGIKKIIAIHRGFYSYSGQPYRNNPMWEIPIELKRILPNLPVICDPSHICGNTNLIPDISQKAMDLGMEGLMIEVHIHPEQALTDIAQQLSPAQLKTFLDNLVIRSNKNINLLQHGLEELRSEIDHTDAELLEILSKRMQIIEKIGRYKKLHNITAFQIKRWNEVRERFIRKGTLKGMDKEFLINLLETIHKESIRRQSEIFKKTPGNNDQ